MFQTSKQTIKTILFFILFFLLLPLNAFAKLSSDPKIDQWAYKDIKVYEAWDYTTGSDDVVVAVVDNGFDAFHPDLLGNVWQNTDEIDSNGIDDDGNGYIDDTWGWNFAHFSLEDKNNDGKLDVPENKGDNNPRPVVEGLTAEEITDGTFHHGTLVAGIIGAVGNNETDGAGLNWKVKLMNVKVVGNSGEGDIRRLIPAIRYAVDNGAHIINISMVGSLSFELIETIQYAHSKGVLVVAAAGNEGRDLNVSPLHPICVDTGLTEQWVIGVSAINEQHNLAHFSNAGSNCIDITAPGTGVFSTLRFSPTNGLPERYGGAWSGTSFAAPLVSGAAALVKSIQPTWSAKQLTTAILSTVHKTSGQDEGTYSTLFGKGLLQINKAVDYAIAQGTIPLAPGPVTTTSSTEMQAPVALTPPVETISPVNPEKALVVFEKDSGMSRAWFLLSKQDTEELFEQFKNVDDIVSFLNEDNNSEFATVKTLDKKKSRVIVYDAGGDKRKEWDVPLAGALEIVAADTTGDGIKEIIVAPTTANTILLSIYSLDGKKLSDVTLPAKHAGVFLAMHPNIVPGKEGVAALYTYQKKVVLRGIHETGTVAFEKILAAPTAPGPIAVGDIDGDGENEYVIGSRSGQDPFLYFLETDGSQKKTFTPYDPSYKGGVDVMMVDLDGDEREDVAVVPRMGGMPVRMFSGKGKKVEEWLPFEKVGLPVRFLGTMQ